MEKKIDFLKDFKKVNPKPKEVKGSKKTKKPRKDRSK
jgi:hypothetical protein